jgi:hypothetical protein
MTALIDSAITLPAMMVDGLMVELGIAFSDGFLGLIRRATESRRDRRSRPRAFCRLVGSHAVVVNTNVADFAPVDRVLLCFNVLVDDAERHVAIALVGFPVHAL